jgi:transcription antitermination factor NusG
MLDAAPATRLDAPTPDAIEHLGCYGNDAARWCVARSHPQAERWADSNLRRLGFVTYLPLYATRRRDRVVPSMFHTVEAPLFVSYLFVRNDNPDLWRPIREAPGVAAVLTCGNRIQYANAEDVEALQATDAARRTHPTGQGATWRPGAAVRVCGGIFDGHAGVVVAGDGDTVRVAVMFLGQLRTVALPAEFLTARDEG